MKEAPRGLLRVTPPLDFAYLGPSVAAFLERNPEMQLDRVCADGIVHLVQGGFDLAVRAGPLADSTLIARHLGTFASLLVAAPTFLAVRDERRLPTTSRGFDALVFGAGADRARWAPATRPPRSESSPA